MTGDNVSFDIKKLQIIIAIVLSVFGAGYGIYEFGSTYHSKYVEKAVVESNIRAVQKEVLTVAKLGYEDQLVELDYLQATGQATDLDNANRANIERRLSDLKDKLSKLQ